jgi:hypothetical protein
LARPDDPFAVLPMTVDLYRLAGQVVLVAMGGDKLFSTHARALGLFAGL